MDEKTAARIQAIETRVAEIDAQIAQLEQARELAILEDAEYAGYREYYQSFYEDEPLSIRAYYAATEEWEQINAELNKVWRIAQQQMVSADRYVAYEELCQKHARRLKHLERVLAA